MIIVTSVESYEDGITGLIVDTTLRQCPKPHTVSQPIATVALPAVSDWQQWQQLAKAAIENAGWIVEDEWQERSGGVLAAEIRPMEPIDHLARDARRAGEAAGLGRYHAELYASWYCVWHQNDRVPHEQALAEWRAEELPDQLARELTRTLNAGETVQMRHPDHPGEVRIYNAHPHGAYRMMRICAPDMDVTQRRLAPRELAADLSLLLADGWRGA